MNIPSPFNMDEFQTSDQVLQSATDDAFGEGVISDYTIRSSFDGTYWDDKPVSFDESLSSGESDLSYESPDPYTSDASAGEETNLTSDIPDDYILSLIRRTGEVPEPLVTPNLQYFDGLPNLPFTMASFELPGSNLNDNLELDDEFQVFDPQAWTTNTVIEVIDPSQVFRNETGSEVVNTNRARKSGPARRRSPAHKVSFQPYHSPAASPSLLSPSLDNPRRTKAGRSGHVAGINRQTGEPTLVGRYPPVVVGTDRFFCPHPVCDELRGGHPWTSKNGYKYHLMWNCFQNPESSRSKKHAAGELSEKLQKGKGKIVATCVCGQPFKSENGYRMHLEKNKTTYGGRCIERTRRRMEGCQPQESQTQEAEDSSSQVPNGQEIGYETGSEITES